MFKCRYSELWECVNKTTGLSFCVKILESGGKAELDMLRLATGYNSRHPHPNLVVLVEASQLLASDLGVVLLVQYAGAHGRVL